jgi:hypothetical protein
MGRTILALTIAALANFATAVHADSAAPGSTVTSPQARQSVDHLLVALWTPELVRPSHRWATPADVIGKGTIGEACHAERPNSNGSTDHCNYGNYKEKNGDLFCTSSLCEINCFKDDKSFPPKATCHDGGADN